MLVSLLWFLIILSVIVIGHEFGHYLLAKANGIHVVEFSMGMGPTLLHFTKGDTIFSLKLLPIGGACRFEGEDGLDGDGQTEKESTGRGFNDANVYSRIATVFAGPFFNFIIAFIFAMIIVANCGSDLPTIQGLTEGRPAATSGLEVGDLITSINGENIHLWRDITLISLLNSGETLTVSYLRDGEKGTCTITPLYSAEDNRYYIGIEGGTDYIECKGLKLFKYSFYELVFNFRNTFKSLKQMVLGRVSADDIAGPVGIAQVVDDTYEVTKQYGMSTVILNMMNLAMLLSVNLGVINLLPLPALDGGRLVFLFVEILRGKPIPPEKEGMVHLVGIILFFALTILIFLNDLRRIFG